LKRFIEDYLVTKATVPVVIRLDDDDPTLKESLALDWPDSFEILVDKRKWHIPKHQEMFEIFPNEDCYGLIGDDNAPRTIGWDEKTAEACGSWNIVYTTDLDSNGNKFPDRSFCMVGGGLLRTWGRVAPEGMNHLYIDNVWAKISEELDNRVYLKDVVIEHLHPWKGKVKRDATYNRTADNGVKYSKDDRKVFIEWAKNESPTLVKKMRAAMEGNWE
jgi:hypothetical protein